MKLKFAFASLLVLSACGTSQDALQALQSMQILENNPGEGISYAKLSGSGNDVTLDGVTFLAPASTMAMMSPPAEDDAAPAAPVDPNAPPVAVVKARTMKLNGLTMKDGKPVVRDIVVSDLTPAFPTEGAVINIGSIGFEGLNEQTGKFIAGSFTKEGPGATPAFADWAFKKASVNGISVAGTIPQEGGAAGSLNFKLGEISVSNLKDQTIGLARVAGIKGDVDVPSDMMPVKGTFDFGTLDIEKIRGGMFAEAFEAGMASVMDPAGQPDFSKVFANYTSPLEGGLDALKWTGAKIDVSGVKLDTSAMSHIVTRNADDVVIATHSPRATVKLTADSSGGTLGAMGLMVLAMTGYPSNVIELYSQGDATFDPARDLTRYDGYNFGVTDVFDIKVAGGVLGLKQALPALLTGLVNIGSAMEAADAGHDEDADSDDADEDDDADDDADEGHAGHADGGFPPAAQGAVMQMVMGMIGMQLTDLDIAITDKTLVDLILTQTAMQSGQSVAAYRQDLVSMVSGSMVFLTDAGVDPAIAGEATAAIAGFLAGPGTLHIQIKPKTPFGVMTAMVAPVTKDSLGFSATFTPAAPATN